jgi:3-isopropylmalate dehydrogenase
MSRLVAVLPGDGIGPEVVAEALKVLRAAGVEFEAKEALVGGAAYDALSHPLPMGTLELCRRADAVLLGAVGGPKWDKVEPISMRPEVGALLPLRANLGLFANLRPAKTFAPLAEASPLKGGNAMLDLIVVRELTGGIYFGKPRERTDGGARAVDTCVYTKQEVARIAERAADVARTRARRVVSVDKANVLETSRLWRETVDEVFASHPDVELSHILVDNCAMQLVRDPRQFDVILTENMFGDILSDQAAMLTGSLGLLPSASLGEGTFGLYEPAHGSAPDIAGKGLANPIATVLSAAMMTRYSFGLDESADAIEAAVSSALADGVRTADIAAGGPAVSTAEMGDEIARRVSRA